jgi:hypothetical protein
MHHLTQTELKGIWAQQPPKYSSGKYVVFEGKIHKILAATHTHVQLEGLKFAVPEWQVKSVKRPSSTYKPKGLVSAEEEILREGTDPRGDRNCLRSPGEVFPTAGEGLIGRKPTACDLSRFSGSLTVLRFRGTVKPSIFDKFQENCFPSAFKNAARASFKLLSSISSN